MKLLLSLSSIILFMKPRLNSNSVYDYFDLDFSIRKSNYHLSDIINCYFTTFTTIAEHGGVIHFATGDTYLLVLRSNFYYCQVSGSFHGGAIYFSSSTGSVFLSKVCATECFITPGTGNAHGQFIHTYTKPNLKNCVELTSIYRCASVIRLLTRYAYHMSNGNQSLQSVNSSNNNCEWGAGFYCESSSSLIFNFCTFYEDSSVNFILHFHNPIANQTISFNNIIKSNSTLNSAVVYSTTKVFIDSCHFRDNFNVLFQGHLEIIRCYISHVSTPLGRLARDIDTIHFHYSNCYNNDVCMQPTQILTHYSSFRCYTNNILIIEKTPEKTECVYILPPTPAQTIPTNCAPNSNQNNIIIELANLQNIISKSLLLFYFSNKLN